MVEVLKVSSKSSPNAVAGALAAVVRQTGEGEIQVVGAGALNQAVKAIAIARGFLESTGVDLVCTPVFADIEIAGEERTAIRLLCRDRIGEPAAPEAADALTVDLRAIEVAAVAAAGTGVVRP